MHFIANPKSGGEERRLKLCYLRPLVQRAVSSSAEFHKILDHRGVVQNGPIGALAHLGLAWAYGLQGDTAKTRAAYEDFFTLWSGADPGIPILLEAKAKFAKLK